MSAKSEKKKCPYQDIGGQAVMEGVMMQSPANESIAIAVRRPSGRIVVTCEKNTPLSKKHPWMGWPIIRGCVNMVLMLKMGMQTLDRSTQMLGVMEEEPTKFEKWLAEKLGAKIDKVVMAVAMVLAVVLSLFLFVALPTGAATLAGLFTDSRLVINLVSGVTRVAILILYMWGIGFVPDIKRVFMYHGAEHKSIFCYESGLPLTVENAQKFTTLHPRCGTSFLVIVMVISIFIFTVLGTNSSNVFARVGSRLLLLPLVAGISYEILKWLGRAEDTPIVRALKWPGLMVQKITTAQPTDDMVEVALISLKASLGMPDALPKELDPDYVAPTEEPEEAAQEGDAPAEDKQA